MRLVLHQFLTLDGVCQAPGGPEEDREGGFAHGGWQARFREPEAGGIVASWFAQAGAFLLGRKTYDNWSAFWPAMNDHPIGRKLNALPKYVTSTTSSTLEWNNATLLTGNVAAEIAGLKDEPGGELQLHGSGSLAQTLIAHDLIDEYRLAVFPVHVGAGKRLFRDDTRAGTLRLIDSHVTSGGIAFITYAPDGDVRHGDHS